MRKLRIILSILLSILILLSTISLARNGKVNAPNGLILREDASFSGKVITTIQDNVKVEILEENGDWYKVKYETYEGYLYAKYVRVEKEATVDENKNNNEQTNIQTQNVKSNMSIYLIPSMASQVIENVSKDAKLTVNYELGNWVNVSFEGKEGWVRKYVLQGGNTISSEDNNQTVEVNKSQDLIEDANTIAEENKKGYVNVNSSAIIREDASTSSDVVGTLSRNAEVQILGEKGDFYQIRYNELTGYMSKKLISLIPVE